MPALGAVGANSQITIMREATFGGGQVKTSGVNIAIDSTAKTITRASAGFITLDGWVNGDTVMVQGSATAGNNGVAWTITTLTDTVMTFTTMTGATTVASAAGVSVYKVPTILRAKIGSKLDLKRDTFASKEMSSTRQVMGLTYGNRSGSADIPFEFSYGTYDDLMESILGGTWSTNVLKIGNTKRSYVIEQQFPDINTFEIQTGVVPTSFSLSVKPNAIVEGSISGIFKDELSVQTVRSAATGAMAITATTITRTTGDFSADGFVAGDLVSVSGALTSANNKSAQIVTVAATTLTFAAATFTADAVDQTNLIVSKTGNLSGVVVSANSNTPFDSFTGSIVEGGTTLAIVTGIDIKIEQNADGSNVLFDPTIQQVSLGTVKVSGTVVVRFINNVLKKKFMNGTATSLNFTLGATSKTYAFNFGTVKYLSATGDSVETELSQTFQFQAIYDGTDTSSVKVTRTP